MNKLHFVLKSLRKEKKKTQEYIAQILSVSQQAYNNYELGKRQPDLETIVKIALYYKVSVEYLLGLTDDKTSKSSINEEERKLLINFSKLTNENKSRIFERIEMLIEQQEEQQAQAKETA